MKAKKRNVKRIRVKKRQQEVNAKNWPIVKVTLPADLKGVKPGEVPAHLLRDVKPYGKLYWRAADAYHAMRAKAFADGIKPFKPTSAGDTSIPEATARRRIDTHLGRRQVVQEVTDHGVARCTWHISTQPRHRSRHLVGLRQTLRMVARQRT
jgi:hypothetical protein